VSDRMPQLVQLSLRDAHLGRPLIVLVTMGSTFGGVSWIR